MLKVRWWLYQSLKKNKYRRSIVMSSDLLGVVECVLTSVKDIKIKERILSIL